MNGLINRYVSLSLLAALTGACVEKEGESSTTSGATEDSTGTTSGDSTGDSTGAATETTGEPTTGEPTTGEPTTGEPTTGEPGGLCEAWAKWMVMCGGSEPGSEAEVVSECEQQRGFTEAVYGPACAVKSDAFLECQAMTACDDQVACEAEFDAIASCEPEVGETCKAFAAAIAACEPDEGEAELAASCQFDVNAAGFENPACGAAFEALHGCFAGLDCVELESGTACEAEGAMVDASCPGENGAPAHPRALELETHRR